MRKQNRQYNEIRPVEVIPNYTEYAEGSVLFSMGNTKVLCNATVQENVPQWMKNNNIAGGWITSEYALLPRSTNTRTPRESAKVSGRTAEIRRLIGRSLRAAVNLELLGARTIIIDCDVLQADGGTRTASITGGYIALAIAIKRLIEQNEIPDNVLGYPVAAISDGIVDGQPMLDLCYEEDHQAAVDGNFVMNSNGEFIEIQITGEKSSFSNQQLSELISLARKGIESLFKVQQDILSTIER